MAPPTTITLGGLFPSSGGWAVGPTVIPAFTLAIEEINASPTLLPSTTLLYHHNDSACSAITGLSALHYQNTFPNSIDVVIGDGCSTACQLQAKTCEAWKMPQLSWGCVSPALSDKTEFPYFLRTVSPDTHIASAFSDFIHTRTPWRNVAWVCEDEDIFTLTAAAFQEAQLDHPADPITTRLSEIFQPAASLATLSKSVFKIKESRAKIIFVAAYSNNVRTLLSLLHDAGLTQPGFQLFIAGSGGDCVMYNPLCPGPNGETTETDQVVLAAAQGAIFTVLHNPTASPAYQTFASKMVTRMSLDSPDQVNVYAATAYEAVYSYANALHTFAGDVRNEQDKPLFLEHLRASSTPGVVAQLVDYDSNGDRVSTLAIMNFNTTATSAWNPIFLWNKRAGLITQSDFLPPLYTGSTPVQPSTDMSPLTVLSSLTLGGNFPVTGGWPVGNKIIPAVELAIEEINASADLLPATTLKLYVNDSACDADIGLKNMLWQDEHPRSIDMILGDGCSTACQAQAAVAVPKQLPQISYSCTSPALSDKLRFPYFVRTVSPDTVVGEAFASFVLSATPWRHVAFLSENHELFTLAVEKFEETNRKRDVEDRIEVDHYIFADGDSLEQHMQNLAASGVRIWVANAYINNVRSMLKIGKRLGIAGEGYQVLLGGGMPDCVLHNPTCPGPNGEVEELDLDILAAVEGALSTYLYTPVGEPAYEAIVQKMVERTSAESAAEVNPYALNAYEAVYAYAHAVDSFDSTGGARSVRTHKYEFMEHLKTSISPGVYGEVKFDANGDRILRQSIVTFDYGLNGDKSNGMFAPVYTFSSTDGLTMNEGVQVLWTGGASLMAQESYVLVEEEAGGVATAVVFGIVGGAVALVLLIVAVNLMKERRLRKETTAAEGVARRETLRAEDEKIKGELITAENFKLKNDVAIMQEYNKDEIAMLESQIKKFTAEMSATDGVHKDMEKLLVKADELVGKVVIGAGAYGEVYKSDYRGTAVAVKTMIRVDEESLERFQGEIMLMSGLRHQNVVTMVGCCWEKDLMALVMEFCEKGTSSDILKAEGDQMTWDDPLLKWLLDVSRGMSYLHGMAYYDADKKEQVRGIIHRDLKPDNCLVTETWGVKIADFGEARAALENATMTQVGTPIYIAPEVVRGEYYSDKADVFSFAMTILQFCLKKKPLLAFLKEEYTAYKKREPTLGRVSHEVVVKGWRPDMEGIEGVPRTVVEMLDMCWAEYPDARPTFVDIFEYVQAEVRNEVMGEEGGGTEGKGGRRTSTSGGLAMRIETAKFEKDDEETRENDDKGAFVEQYREENVKLKEENERLKLLVKQGGGELPGQA